MEHEPRREAEGTKEGYEGHYFLTEVEDGPWRQ